MEQKEPILIQQLDGFAGMLCHLCRRPRMYTMSGTFREVLAFLTGYDHARGLTIGMGCMNSELHRFGEWLRKRCGYDEHMSWHCVLLRHCDNDEQCALEQMWPLYAEFMDDSENPRTRSYHPEVYVPR